MLENNKNLEAEIQRLNKIMIKDQVLDSSLQTEVQAKQDKLTEKGLHLDEKWVKSKRVQLKQLSEIKPSVMFDPEVDAEYRIGLQSMFEEQETKVKTLQGIQQVLRRLLHSNSKSVYI